ncbi:N-acetylneuraminate synthase family protein [Natronorubrum sulfidifaciens]|uniref:N-acetylneuraminate synthase n=1 Tax=Natronorubrum sulfidifaciens JCM 14089 TaxID=1230460 RepID=L9WBB3_9EURY|nr:N-acetylneuraminate synthase family protein [Natronorubrum sulfidifaciens]ELY45588.1 N-acetylneuraminate synthase [Natronorubrum sulfidifaciens JCM 14089]
METFDIGGRAIGPGEPTYVIAEAGSNHNGDLETAKELIDAAADAGADAVKFQTFRAEDLYVDDRDLVDDPEDSTYALLESLEQPYEWIPELYEYCESRDIQFMSSPFDERSTAELAEYVPAFKVASFTLSHHPFLEDLAEYDKPVIMSTGAHEQAEVEEAVGVLRENGVEDIALLHCVSSYPTPLEEINVRAVETLNREFDTVVGFSDHTTDPATAPAAAVALGASVVEKHFTLDKEMEGPDHSFALEPDELGEMIDKIRKTERTLGDGKLTVRNVEQATYDRSRRGIHATRKIKAGQMITRDDVQIIRPGDAVDVGAEPKFLDEIVDSIAKADIKSGEGISLDALEI